MHHTVVGIDYTAAVDEQLVFAEGQSVACHKIIIIEENICENYPNEDLFSNLIYVSGIMPILIDPPRTRVVIDDTYEPECSK